MNSFKDHLNTNPLATYKSKMADNDNKLKIMWSPCSIMINDADDDDAGKSYSQNIYGIVLLNS